MIALALVSVAALNLALAASFASKKFAPSGKQLDQGGNVPAIEKEQSTNGKV